MQRVTWSDRVRYATDNLFSKGTAVMIAALAAVSLVLIIGIAFVVWITHAADYSLPELVWMSLMRTLDSGTMGGDSGSWPFLFAMLAVTLGGIFVISTLIGILTNGIDARLDNLRKGRSRVVERDHTVILGWSEQIFPIVSELITANANRRRACIVILGDKDKVEMEDELRARVGRTGNTRVVCRTGNAIELEDLALVSLPTARAIIVLSPESENPDAEVIKTLLAITNAPDRRPEPYHIVAELHDPKNHDVARLAGGDEVEIVLIGDLIARVLAQTCRQSGLSTIYTELLDFGGDEIYFQEEPQLVGRTFGDVLGAYATSAVIGMQPAGRAPQLLPPLDTRIAPGDRIIAISADDDTIVLATSEDQRQQARDYGAVQLHDLPAAAPERTLLLGWNWRAPSVITELDGYVAPGSEVLVVAEFAGAEPALARCESQLHNQTVRFLLGDTTDRRLLDALDIPSYNHVILLCYSELMTPQQADSRTLITLLHLRDIGAACGNTFSITSEMLDPRNRALAEVTQADDFIVSNHLISLMLAQIAENKALNAVFADLFDPEGAEIYLKPMVDYVQCGQELNFYAVVEAARRRGEIAIGYRRRYLSSMREHGHGVVLNPNKAERLRFGEQDSVVVVAEN